jgi:hypothetical protein
MQECVFGSDKPKIDNNSARFCSLKLKRYYSPYQAVRSRVGSSWICGGRSDTGEAFLRVLWFPLPIFMPPNSPSPGAGTIGKSAATVPSGPSWTPPPTKANLTWFKRSRRKNSAVNSQPTSNRHEFQTLE